MAIFRSVVLLIESIDHLHQAKKLNLLLAESRQDFEMIGILPPASSLLPSKKNGGGGRGNS